MPGYNLTYQVFNDQIDQGVGIIQAVSAVNQGVSGVIGSLTSGVSQVVQLVLRTAKIPQLSMTSTSDTLSDKKTYPYFLRNTAPDRFQARAMLDIVLYYNWTRVAAISSTDIYGSGGIANFLVLAASKKIEVLNTQTYNLNTQVDCVDQITALKRSGARIFVIFGNSADQVMAEAARQGIVGPDYVWVGSDAASGSMQNVTGLISTTAFLPNGNNYNNLVTRVNALAAARGFTPSIWSVYGYLYDALWLYARAYDRVIQSGRDVTNGTDVLLALYAENGFDGTTGPTYFDANGDRLAPFTVFNIDNTNTLTQVGRWDTINGLSLTAPIVFSSGKTTPPPDRLILLPVVLGATPPPGTTTADVLSAITLTFNEPMNNLTSSPAFMLKDDAGVQITGVIEWANEFQFMKFTPSTPLRAGSVYRVSFLRSGSSLKYGDQPTGDYSYSFTTAAASQVVETKVESKAAAIAAPVVVVVLLIVGTAITIILVRRARRKRTIVHTYSIEVSNKIDYDDVVIIRSVGMGSFGEVFRATWRGTDVAVKKLLATVLTPKTIEEFVKETMLISQLRHPNIVLFMGTSTEPPVIMTEFMTRGSLYDALANKDINIGLPLKLKWAQEVAYGMQYLHASGVLHRDLKSLNILLDHNWTAKITDFGLSSVKEQTETKTENVGSLYWTAPEVFADPNSFTPASDMYSYGIVLWEVLTRQEPYSLANQYRVAVDVMRGTLRPDIKGLDGQQVDLCSRCWHQEVAKRPTWQKVSEDLRALVPPGEPLIFPVISAQGEMPKGNMSLVVTFIPNFAERVAEAASSNGAELKTLVKCMGDSVKTISNKHHGHIIRVAVDSILIVFQNSKESGNFAAEMLSWLWGVVPSESSPAHHEDPRLKEIPTLRHHLLKHDDCADCKEYAGMLDQASTPEAIEGVKTPAALEDAPLSPTQTGPPPRARNHIGLAVHVGEPEVKRSATSDGLIVTGPPVEYVYALAECGWGGTCVFSPPAVEKHNPILPDINCVVSPPFPATVLGGKISVCQVAPRSVPVLTRAPTPAKEPTCAPWAGEPLPSIVLRPDQVTVDERIAPGTYGVAHKGHVAGVKTMVLVKRLIRQTLDPEGLIAFAIELQALSMLRHPNIMSYLAVVVSPPFALVTDFATGKSLKDALHGPTPMAEGARLSVARGIADGLAFLHEKGVLHGSIRPCNVMLTDGNVPRLSDYALSHLKESMQTMTGTGTTAYTAPEILRGAGGALASDVYSTAIVLWELFNWRNAHTGIPAMAVAMEVLAKGLRPAIGPTMNPDVGTLLSAAWADKPETRPSARDVATRLAAIK